jgi:pyruvate formate lyase activating enzyme
MMGEGNKAPDSRPYAIEEVLAICLQDQPFYEESGGGVTFSGGEALTQPKFAATLLQLLREKGIHTALETSGYAPAVVFNEVSALADLLLFDIKHYDDCRHVEGTGVHNDLILINLKTALTQKMSILPRIAIIPGYNDSQEDAYGFASLLKSLGLECVQLLPFHQFGERKYELLNIPYAMR